MAKRKENSGKCRKIKDDKPIEFKGQFKITQVSRPLRKLHEIGFEVREGHQNLVHSQFVKQIPKSVNPSPFTVIRDPVSVSDDRTRKTLSVTEYGARTTEHGRRNTTSFIPLLLLTVSLAPCHPDALQLNT